MPRTRTIKSTVVELVMYIGMFAVVGHLCENLYERFTMKTDLSNMKADLSTMQIYITNIEMAYDSLRDEIQDLTCRSTKRKTMKDKDSIIKTSYNAYLVHKPMDYTGQDLVKQFHDLKTSFTKITNNFMQTLHKKNILGGAIPTKDYSTITDEKPNYCKCLFKCTARSRDSGLSREIDDTVTETEVLEREICCGELDSNETKLGADGDVV